MKVFCSFTYSLVYGALLPLGLQFPRIRRLICPSLGCPEPGTQWALGQCLGSEGVSNCSRPTPSGRGPRHPAGRACPRVHPGRLNSHPPHPVQSARDSVSKGLSSPLSSLFPEPVDIRVLCSPPLTSLQRCSAHVCAADFQPLSHLLGEGALKPGSPLGAEEEPSPHLRSHSLLAGGFLAKLTLHPCCIVTLWKNAKSSPIIFQFKVS